MTHVLVSGFVLVFFLCHLSPGENSGFSSVIRKIYRTTPTNEGPEEEFIEDQNLFKNSVTRSKRFAGRSSLSSDFVFPDSLSATTEFWWQGQKSPFNLAKTEVPVSSQPYNPGHGGESRQQDMHGQPWKPDQPRNSALNKPIDFQGNPFLSSAFGLKPSYSSDSIPYDAYDSPTNAEFPWQAILVLTANYSTLCSATIISDHAVITAGECVQLLESKEIVLKAGKGMLSTQNHPKTVQVRPIIAIVRHQCNAVAMAYDLAILIIKEPLIVNDYLDKIFVPFSSSPWYQPTDRLCIVTGWGQTDSQSFRNNGVFQKVNVKYVPTEQCKLMLKRDESEGLYFESRINDGFTCATPSSGVVSDLCKVKNGGSLICARNDGHYELAGVKRWDFRCKEDLPSIITTCVYAWIHSTLEKSITALIKEEKDYIYSLNNPSGLNGFFVANQLNKLLNKTILLPTKEQSKV